MTAIKRIGLLALLLGAFAVSTAPPADAGIIFRGGPVRRVAARAVLPPYPVARRAVVGPVYRPYYRPYARPYAVGYGPRFYGPGVSVGVGIY